MEKENAINFLLYSYFGIEAGDLKADNEAKLILKCAKRAYQDLCRTLKFREKTSTSGLKAKQKQEIERAHQDFRDAICKEISQLISNSLLTATPKDFDTKHEEACGLICKLANSSKALSEDLHDGQAQKWLNMTIKYMWLLDLRKDDFGRLMTVIHVPVDSYIMEAAAKEKIQCVQKSWSKWEYAEYLEFQKALRKLSSAPLEWEGPAWIEIAKEKASN